MRLTHFVKVDARDRASIEASIHFSQHPDEIPIRISQFGAGEPIWLTWAEFDAVADLVRAHRPEPATTGQCGYDWLSPSGVFYCCLGEGHSNNGAWLHVAADGSCNTR